MGAGSATITGNAAGFKKIRCRISPLGSGETVTINIVLSIGASNTNNRMISTLTDSIAIFDSAAQAIILGQNTKANSLPVTLASNQGNVAISATSLPLPTGASTDASLTETHATTGSTAASKSELLGGVYNTTPSFAGNRQ